MNDMYASKRRQRNFKRVRDTSKRANEPSNPSKRHRERLNGELETVASLLPYDQHVIQRLDKLSVLRLAVSYLHIKAHFQICAHSSTTHSCPGHPLTGEPTSALPQLVPTLVDRLSGMPIIDSNEPVFHLLVQKALGGFALILSESGEIYYVTENIETYLGFLQPDVLHQSVYEMIHSEDREGLRQNLVVNSTDLDLPIRRSIVVRFRCLLDNTCGFVRVEISGRMSQIHGAQCASASAYTNAAADTKRFALIAICTPFVSPLQMDPALDDPILKTKHSLDLSFFSVDQRLHLMLELKDNVSAGYGSCAFGGGLPPGAAPACVRVPSRSFYSFVHPDDMKFVADAHESVIKYCSSGLIIYRLMARLSGTVHYVQSSLRLFFKNGKPESIGGNHRLLTEVNGQALLEKRNSLKFKLVSFDDTLLQSPRMLQPPPPQQQILPQPQLPSAFQPFQANFLVAKSAAFYPPAGPSGYDPPQYPGDFTAFDSSFSTPRADYSSNKKSKKLDKPKATKKADSKQNVKKTKKCPVMTAMNTVDASQSNGKQPLSEKPLDVLAAAGFATQWNHTEKITDLPSGYSHNDLHLNSYYYAPDGGYGHPLIPSSAVAPSASEQQLLQQPTLVAPSCLTQNFNFYLNDWHDYNSSYDAASTVPSFNFFGSGNNSTSLKGYPTPPMTTNINDTVMNPIVVPIPPSNNQNLATIPSLQNQICLGTLADIQSGTSMIPSFSKPLQSLFFPAANSALAALAPKFTTRNNIFDKETVIKLTSMSTTIPTVSIPTTTQFNHHSHINSYAQQTSYDNYSASDTMPMLSYGNAVPYGYDSTTAATATMAAYAANSAAGGFNFLSEVANTLLG